MGVMWLTIMLVAAASSREQNVSCTAALRGTTMALNAGLTVTVKQQEEVLKLQTGKRQDALPTYPCRSGGRQEFVPVKIMNFNFGGVSVSYRL